VTPEKDSLSLKFADGDATRPIMAKLSDLAARRAWLKTSGVNNQVVGGWLDMFGYELPADEGADWARFNERAYAQCGEGGASADAAVHGADAERQARRGDF